MIKWYLPSHLSLLKPDQFLFHVMEHIFCSMASMNQLLKTFVADGTLMENSTIWDEKGDGR